MRVVLFTIGAVLLSGNFTSTQAQNYRTPQQYRQQRSVENLPVRPGYGQGSNNAGVEIFKGILDLGVRAAQEAERNRRYEDNYDYRPQPRYGPQPQYYAPSPVPPAAPAAPAPPRNVAVPKKAPKNSAFQLTGASFNLMSAELDARQGIELTEAGGKLDSAVNDNIDNSALTPQEKADAKKAWEEAVTSGDLKKFEDFQKNFGGKLSADGQKLVETRVELLKYGEDLLGGGLTPGQKEVRLDRLDKLIAGLPPGALQNGLQDNFDQMRKFNDLSNLVTLTQGNDDALLLIVTGSNNAGLGPGFVAEISGVPVMESDPLSDSKVAITDILLMNDPDSQQAISYSLGQHGFSMQPGEKQALTKSYTVSFEPEPGATPKQYSLVGGVYRFVQTSQGWDLSKDEPIKVVVDNSENTASFGYLLNGKQFSLTAGEAKEHTDTKAIAIEFDRGNGTTTRKVVSTGTYRVGIDPNGSLLDLYEAERAATGTETVVAARPARQTSGAKSKAKQIEEALARLKAKKT